MSGTVLVVDDNVALAEDLQEILEEEGFVVEVAHDGSRALERLEDGGVDAVITDVQMPGLNGVEVLRYIKGRWPALPVVVMSGYARDALLSEAESGGALAVLTKPFDLDELTALVARAVTGEMPLLLVEDDDAMRAVLLAALREIPGALPHGARDAAEARRLALAVRPRAAVVDIRLPDGDGLQLGRWLRHELGDPDLPVVYVTGHAGEVVGTMGALLASPGFRLMEKPFDVGELIRVVHTAVHDA